MKTFLLEQNDEKSIAPNTLKIYKRYLNKLAVNLHVTCADDIIEHGDEIVAWIEKNTQSMTCKKQFVAAIMYVINKKEYPNYMRLAFVVYFFKLKIKQIEDNTSISAEEKQSLLIRLNDDLQDLES